MQYRPQNIGIEIITDIIKSMLSLLKRLLKKSNYFGFILLITSCTSPDSNSTLSDTDSLDGMTAAEWKTKFMDSLDKDITKKIYFNFTDSDLAKAPVKVLSARPVEKEYSNYKDIRLSWKNVSNKTISAIKFRWSGINAFGEKCSRLK